MWQEPNALLYCKKFQKNQISRNFGLLMEHGPHWINFIILTFISVKKKKKKKKLKKKKKKKKKKN